MIANTTHKQDTGIAKALAYAGQGDAEYWIEHLVAIIEDLDAQLSAAKAPKDVPTIAPEDIDVSELHEPEVACRECNARYFESVAPAACYECGGEVGS